MSAFIVSHNTINRVVTFMLQRLTDGKHRFMGLNSPLEDEFERPDQAAKKYGKKLHELNVEAVKCRYGDDIADMMPDAKYKFSREFATDEQVLKSLDCLIYQCSEGDVPTCSLFQEILIFRDKMAYCMATDTKEYAKSEWG